MDRHKRARLLIAAVERRDGRVRLAGDGVTVDIPGGTPDEVCEAIVELRAELIEYLRTEAEEVVDILHDRDAVVLNSTPSRPVGEIQADVAKARTASAKRDAYFGGGELLITNHDNLTPANDRNHFGHRMRLLSRDRERRAAADRGALPPEGRYISKWNLFE